MNSFTLEARLGKDAEIRETAGKTKFLAMSVVETQYNSSKKENESHWYDVVCFNYSEKAVQHYKKGSLLFITGQLTVEIENCKDGVARIRRRLYANSINFPESGPKSKDEQNPNPSAVEANSRAPQPITRTAGSSSEEESDLPF